MPALVANSGMLGLGPRIDCGGGGGPIELAILAEELGRSSLDVAMSLIGAPFFFWLLWRTRRHLA